MKAKGRIAKVWVSGQCEKRGYHRFKLYNGLVNDKTKFRKCVDCKMLCDMRVDIDVVW